MPHGLEEVWRFTPLKRLRKLHADAPLGTGSVTVDAGVHDDLSIRTVDGRRVPCLAGDLRLRADRPDRCPHLRRDRHQPDRGGAGRGRSRPADRGHPARQRDRGRRGRSHRDQARSARPGDRAAGARRLGDVRPGRGDRAGGRRPGDRDLHPELGRRHRPPGSARREDRPGRHAQARRGHLRRRRGPDQRAVWSTQRRAAPPRCSVSTSSTPVSTSSTGCSSTTTSPRPVQRGLPRRPAGQGCALGLDRRRADPQGGRGHRDLRVQQEPGAHRRLSRRLGAEPGDRDRRDRRRRARLDHRSVRRRAAVLPAQPGNRRGRGASTGRARLLRRHHPPDRRALDRGGAARPRWRRSSP